MISMYNFNDSLMFISEQIMHVFNLSCVFLLALSQQELSVDSQQFPKDPPEVLKYQWHRLQLFPTRTIGCFTTL